MALLFLKIAYTVLTATLTLRGFEEMFNRGDLSVVDELVAGGSVDHQEATGTDAQTCGGFGLEQR
jgi:hypothetical protein